MSYVFISHDLAVVRAMSHRVLVMKDGAIVEQGEAEALFAAPREKYTQTLLAAAASPDVTPEPHDVRRCANSRVVRRRLHLPPRALSHDDQAAVRPLLPLPLVPARDRLGVRAERDDRGRPRRACCTARSTWSTRRRQSGKGQKISRCPKCRVAVWSNYAGGGDAVRFVRVGTLDEPDRLPPDVHIFTAVEAALGRAAGRARRRIAEYYKARRSGPRTASRGAQRCSRSSASTLLRSRARATMTDRGRWP